MISQTKEDGIQKHGEVLRSGAQRTGNYYHTTKDVDAWPVRLSNRFFAMDGELHNNRLNGILADEMGLGKNRASLLVDRVSLGV